MNRRDLAINDAGAGAATLKVTASGDVATVSGSDSVRQRGLLAAVTSPGALLHRPGFGAGVERYLGQPTTVAAAGFASAWRASLLQDDRVRKARVSVNEIPGRREGFVATAVVETNAGDTATFSFEV